jgi:cellulose synthase/poly-beta-1,6-N-acetylglucosamine synthase-like glycosyltransferase
MQLLSIAVFFAAAAFLVWVLAGYPVVVAWLAQRRGKDTVKRFEPLSVSVLLPVRNGEQWLRKKLESIAALDYPPELLEVLVVSDASEDETDVIAASFGAPVRLIRAPVQGGKAAALNLAVPQARGEILFFTDVRQPLDRSCLKRLVSCFADSSVGAACGELIILDGETNEEASVGIYWRFEKWLRKHLSRLDSLMVVTGCVFAMRRSLAVPLPEDALGDDIYLPQSVVIEGHRVLFEDTAKAFDYPTAMRIEFHRKARTLAGLYQYTVRHAGQAFGRANRLRWHFFWYKVGRLLLPYALIAIALSTPGLPEPLRSIAAWAQIAFYGLAALDFVIPDRIPLKRLTSPARAFVMLMAASLWAASVFFMPARRLWKTTYVRAPRSRA